MDNRTSKPFKPNSITLLTILLSSMIILMGAAAVAPALKPIAEHFDISSEFVVSLVVSLPSLSCAITGFGVGWLADRIGKVKVFFLAMAVFTISGAIGFLLDDFLTILVFRFILGIGITGISLTTTALIGEYYFGMQRAKVIGYQAAAIGAGTLVLETLGGSLTDIGWNYPFLIYLIGMPIIILGLTSIRDPARIQRPASENAAMPSELDIPNLGRKIAFCYAMVFLEMFLMFTLPMNFSYYINEMGERYLMVGILLGVMGVAQAVFSILYTRRATKLSEYNAYAIAFLMMGAGLAALHIQELPVTFMSMLLIGFSLGLLMPTVIGQLSMYSTTKTSGKVMGGYSVFLNLSNFVTTLAFAPLLSVMGGYKDAYLVMGAVGLAIAAAVILIRNSERSKIHASDSAVRREQAHEIVDGAPSMYRSVLVATDGSANSDFAIRSAVNIAKKNDARLTVLYVLDPESQSGIAGSLDVSEGIAQAAKEYSADAFARARALCDQAGIGMDTLILSGQPAEKIVEESVNHDLCVCGSLGRTDAKRAMIGSVAEKVVRMAHCPVLVCRNGQA